jgi:hypothetical protein
VRGWLAGFEDDNQESNRGHEDRAQTGTNGTAAKPPGQDHGSAGEALNPTEARPEQPSAEATAEEPAVPGGSDDEKHPAAGEADSQPDAPADQSQTSEGGSAVVKRPFFASPIITVLLGLVLLVVVLTALYPESWPKLGRRIEKRIAQARAPHPPPAPPASTPARPPALAKPTSTPAAKPVPPALDEASKQELEKAETALRELALETAASRLRQIPNQRAPEVNLLANRLEQVKKQYDELQSLRNNAEPSLAQYTHVLQLWSEILKQNVDAAKTTWDDDVVNGSTRRALRGKSILNLIAAEQEPIPKLKNEMTLFRLEGDAFAAATDRDSIRDEQKNDLKAIEEALRSRTEAAEDSWKTKSAELQNFLREPARPKLAQAETLLVDLQGLAYRLPHHKDACADFADALKVVRDRLSNGTSPHRFSGQGQRR